MSDLPNETEIPADSAYQPDAADPSPDPAAWRPWHDSVSPFEGLYQHFTAEIARIEAKHTSGEGHPQMVKLDPTTAGTEVAGHTKKK